MVNLSSLKNNILLISKKLCAVVLSILLLTGNVTVFAETVDFAPGTPVVQALRALGYKFNRNIIVSGNVAGTVSMHLDDVDFDEALRAMSIAAGFSYVKEGKNIVVGTQETVKQMRTYTIHNVDEEAVAKQLKVFVEDEEDVVVNKELHTVAVLGSNGVLNRIEQEIERIDKPVHQVMIRAAIIELNNTKSKNTGVNWSRKNDENISGMHANGNWTDGVGFFERNSFKFQISATLEDTISRGRILARPSIATSDGNKASILMGDKVPVFTSTSTSENADATVSVECKDVGVSLEVTPRINDVENGLVTMDVKPSVSVITAWVESGNNKAPQISERSAQTMVRVKSGETILIGGLLRDEEVRTLKRIPLLSKIPILGALFRNREKKNVNTEIVIAITPIIIRDENGRPVVEEQHITAPLKKEVQVFNVEETELNDNIKVKGMERAATKRDKVNRTDYHTKDFSGFKNKLEAERKAKADGQIAEIDKERQKIYDEWTEDEEEAEKDRKKIKKEWNQDEKKAEEERQKLEKEATKEEEKAAVQEPPQEVQQ
ncbi:MAG: type II secretion system protein GspD, partial [Phascolarctobacterium sp.]|nr:type II secretion system protein GspD [Candidatus Phascolarctobacterium caballi]